jgi:hypothetical protein
LLFLDGWIDAEHLGCFKFLHRAVNLSWAEAQGKCEVEGGYLAEPKTSRYDTNNINTNIYIVAAPRIYEHLGRNLGTIILANPPTCYYTYVCIILE